MPLEGAAPVSSLLVSSSSSAVAAAAAAAAASSGTLASASSTNLHAMSSAASKQRNARMSSLLEDGGTTEAPFRARLHSLFAQIEKEFESLYLENLSLNEKLKSHQAHPSASVHTTSDAHSAHPMHPPPNSATLFNPLHRYAGAEYFDPELGSSASAHVQHAQGIGFGAASSSSSAKNPKMKTLSSALSVAAASATKSDKVKASHKLRAQTSRIVSSFKGQAVISSTVVREYVGHKDGVWSVAVKSGQPIIGTACADHTASIWSIDSGRALLQYHGHSGSVNTIKFHPSKECVLTASGDGTAHIWQAAVKWERESSSAAASAAYYGRQRGHSSEEELDDDDGGDFGLDDERGDRVDVLRTPIAEFGAGSAGHSSVVIAADWLPGGEQIITASWDRTAILWDVETKEALQPLAGHDDELTYAAAHPTQRLVVTSSRDSTFRLWDFRDQIPAVSVFQGHTDSVTSTVFSRDDKVVSGSDDRTVKVWELRNMRSALATIRTDASINKLAVSQSGVIAIPHDNRHIRLFDLNGQRVARLPRSNRMGHQRMASSVAWADDPTYTCNLFSAGFDRRVLGWAICLPKENQP